MSFLGFILRASLAGLAGWLASFGFAPVFFSLATPVSLLLMTLIVCRAALKEAFLCGLAFGGGLTISSTLWISQIATEAAVALLGYQTLLYAVAWLLVRWAWPRTWLGAGLFFAVETFNANWPFGGFGWLRIGYSLLDTPLAAGFPIVGSAVMGFFVVWASLGLAKIVVVRRWAELLASLLCLLLLGGLGAFWSKPSELGTIQIGYVQGGAPGGGVFGIGGPGETTRRHLAETRNLLGRIESGAALRPAVIVWPENGIDTDPVGDAVVGAQIQRLVDDGGIPILLGGFTFGPRHTRSFWWSKDGPSQTYDKIHIVPFGEYVPFRDWLQPFFPMLKYVGEQSYPGTKPGLMEVEGHSPEVGFGDIICFDVAYPRTVAQLATADSRFLVVQSSNAMFSGTSQIPQQFAITRVRAAEFQKEVLVVTTNGRSGLIAADGSVHESWPTGGAASGVVSVRMLSGVTPAAQFGSWFEFGLALLLPALGILVRVRDRFLKRS